MGEEVNLELVNAYQAVERNSNILHDVSKIVHATIAPIRAANLWAAINNADEELKICKSLYKLAVHRSAIEAIADGESLARVIDMLPSAQNESLGFLSAAGLAPDSELKAMQEQLAVLGAVSLCKDSSTPLSQIKAYTACMIKVDLPDQCHKEFRDFHIVQDLEGDVDIPTLKKAMQEIKVSKLFRPIALFKGPLSIKEHALEKIRTATQDDQVDKKKEHLLALVARLKEGDVDVVKLSELRSGVLGIRKIASNHFLHQHGDQLAEMDGFLRIQSLERMTDAALQFDRCAGECFELIKSTIKDVTDTNAELDTSHALDYSILAPVKEKLNSNSMRLMGADAIGLGGFGSKEEIDMHEKLVGHRRELLQTLATVVDLLFIDDVGLTVKNASGIFVVEGQAMPATPLNTIAGMQKVIALSAQGDAMATWFGTESVRVQWKVLCDRFLFGQNTWKRNFVRHICFAPESDLKLVYEIGYKKLGFDTFTLEALFGKDDEKLEAWATIPMNDLDKLSQVLAPFITGFSATAGSEQTPLLNSPATISPLMAVMAPSMFKAAATVAAVALATPAAIGANMNADDYDTNILMEVRAYIKALSDLITKLTANQHYILYGRFSMDRIEEILINVQYFVFDIFHVES